MCRSDHKHNPRGTHTWSIMHSTHHHTATQPSSPVYTHPWAWAVSEWVASTGTRTTAVEIATGVAMGVGFGVGVGVIMDIVTSSSMGQGDPMCWATVGWAPATTSTRISWSTSRSMRWTSGSNHISRPATTQGAAVGQWIIIMGTIMGTWAAIAMPIIKVVATIVPTTASQTTRIPAHTPIAIIAIKGYSLWISPWPSSMAISRHPFSRTSHPSIPSISISHPWKLMGPPSRISSSGTPTTTTGNAFITQEGHRCGHPQQQENTIRQEDSQQSEQPPQRERTRRAHVRQGAQPPRRQADLHSWMNLTL